MSGDGIIAYATYLPAHRLTPDEVPGTDGGRIVAGYDEDAVTLAVEAARRALADRWRPGSVLFATAAPPYLDKTNATAIHRALDLGIEGLAADVIGSPRSAVASLLAATAAGGLAVSADIRVGLPGSGEERDGVDAAAALLCGAGDQVAAQVIARSSVSAEFLDRWRLPGELTSREWEERFGAERYPQLIATATARALADAGIERADHVVVSCANARAASRARRELTGAAPAGSPVAVGYAGVADPGLRLAAALDEAHPGQTVLWVVAADGCDALVLRTTDALGGARRGPSVREQHGAGHPVPYTTYLTWRGLLARQPARRPDPQPPAPPAAARAEDWKFALVGSACRRCGEVHVPPARVCAACGTVDQMDRRPLADRLAEVTSCTVDRLAYSPSPPAIDAVVEFDGGGRYGMQVTDAAGHQIGPGTRARPTFRRLYTAGGIHNYFWKVRPV